MECKYLVQIGVNLILVCSLNNESDKNSDPAGRNDYLLLSASMISLVWMGGIFLFVK